MKVRLDKLVVERALAASRERAQALILAGRVLVDEQKQTKPGVGVDPAAKLRLLGEDLRYVSRGGLKLEGALQHWGIVLEGKACLDVGASTGGFTDCMLQHGARRVVAVDTGYGQIAERLRTDGRVKLLERTNARLLEPGELEQVAGEPLVFLAMDVSFISATLVLPAVARAAPGLREAVVLVKPQFEAGREWIEKGGIVRDERAHALAVDRVRGAALEAGACGVEVIDSPITGAEGNREFLMKMGLGRR
jgi:23S rRNA (cytidine1920-2'-O)/16S rRNA (cytidine1409-2'-O)-methyltransferase